MTPKDLYRISWHEAGHLALARVFMPPPRPISFASIVPDVGGLTTFPKGLNAWASIIVTAAGRQAERFAKTEPMPRRIDNTDRAAPLPEAVDARNEVSSMAAEAFNSGPILSDIEKISKYAAKMSCGNEKEYWRRIRRIKATARLEVMKHKALVFSIARELFLNGSIVIDGDEE